jgi:chloramphenicol-sensitive protein RarD
VRAPLTPPADSADDARRGVLAAASAYLIWGLLTLYWKQLRAFHAFELIGWRIIWSAVVMAITLTAMRRWSVLGDVVRNRTLLGRVTLTGMVLTTNWTVYVWAVVHGKVIETALGYFIAPLGTMAVGVVVLHETIRRAQVVAIGFAVAAVAVITVSYGHVPWMSLAIAATWTVYAYLKKRVPLAAVDSMAAETFVMFIPAVAVAVAFTGRTTSIPTTASVGELLLVAGTGLATVGPLTLFAYASQRVALSVLGPMQYVVPTINFLLAWLVFDEELPADRVVGFVLVWIGLAILRVDSTRRANTTRNQSDTIRDISAQMR